AGRLFTAELLGYGNSFVWGEGCACDGCGNLTKITNGLNLSYDLVGRLTNAVDALSRTNSLVWDTRDWLTQVWDANGKTSSFAYDGNGNTASWTNELGNVTSYAYDALNRLTNVTLPGGSGPFLKYGYDNMGNLTR